MMNKLHLGNENKNSFHSLLFCISLDLHYLCIIIFYFQ